MPKRLKKAPPKDENQAAHALVRKLSGEDDASPVIAPAALSAYMSALGRKGGQISGAKRMQMPVEQRREIASKAARAMWAKRKATKKR